MSKLSKNSKIAVAAGAAAVLGGLAYLFFSGSNTVGGSAIYTDEQLVAVAKEMKRDLFPAYHLVFDMARKMKMMIAAQTRSDPNNLPPQYQQMIFEKAVAQSKYYYFKSIF